MRKEGGSQSIISEVMEFSQQTMSRRLSGAPRGDDEVLWTREHNDHSFDLFRALPQVSDNAARKTKLSKEHTWIRTASWTFCLDCGRRRPDGKIQAEDCNANARATVRVPCDPCCDLPSHTLEEQLEAPYTSTFVKNTVHKRTSSQLHIFLHTFATTV